MIISARWTMGAVQIEDVLLKHPDVLEAAVVGVADSLRGQVVNAFIISDRTPDAAFARALQDFHARTAEPARVSAADRIPYRVAEEAGRQGESQSAA